MKVVIDIPKMAYDAYKEWDKNKVATVEQSIIADGTPLLEGEWIDDFCPKCGVSKYNFFTVIKGANGERTKPLESWNYCPACGADLRGKKVEGDAE